MLVKQNALLCILVTSTPENENTRTLYKITEEALAMGHRVSIFLMDDGVYHVQRQKFRALGELGAELFLCAANALERGIKEIPGTVFGSQYDLAVMTKEADGFLTLR